MVTLLARKLGIALLAIATIAAPVIGAQPRCCKTGALKGSGGCCCGPKAVDSDPSSCCPTESRSCCAAREDAPETDATPTFSDAPCQCKASGQPPAIPSGKHSSETSLETFVALTALAVPADDAQHILTARGHEPEIARGGMSLLKVHCRWTV